MKEQRRGRRIALSPEERDEFLTQARTCRVATISPAGPHVSPLWFVWHDESIWLYSITSSRRFTDLQRDPRVAIVIDDGHGYEELRGVEITGTARVVGEVPRTGGLAVPELEPVEQAFASKYQGRETLAYDGRHAWLTVDADKIVSWDFRKISEVAQCPYELTAMGHVAVVTLDRPEKRNAMDAEMTAALDAALNELDGDPAVRAIVLAGSGPAFSAGTDLATGSGGPTGRGGPYGVTRRTRRVPLIAAVEGPALGGGFEIVLACDLVVASTAASFGLPEVSRGVVATCGGLFRGPRALPVNLATELLLTGDPVDARRALELGLVNRLTDEGGALDEALALAARIAQNSPVAVQATLRSIQTHVAALDHLGWLTTDDATRTVLASPDSAEGKRAFLERRAPVWQDPTD